MKWPKRITGIQAAPEGVLSFVHLQPYYRRLGFKKGDFPEADGYASTAISLPLCPALQEPDQQRFVDTLTALLLP